MKLAGATERKRAMNRARGVSKILNHDTMNGASHRVLMSTSWERSQATMFCCWSTMFLETTSPNRWACLTEVLTGLCLLEVWCRIYLESKVEATCEDMSGVYCFRANSCIAKLMFEECKFSGVIFQELCLELCLHSAEWCLIFWCAFVFNGLFWLFFVPQVEYRGKIARTPSVKSWVDEMLMYLAFCCFQMDLFDSLGVAPHVGCFESFCLKVLKTANKNYQKTIIFRLGSSPGSKRSSLVRVRTNADQ